MLGESPQLRRVVRLLEVVGRGRGGGNNAGNLRASDFKRTSCDGETSLAAIHLSLDQLRFVRGVGSEGAVQCRYVPQLY